MDSEIKIIGAGMWRTGTYSLKIALEQLTGQPCHHMTEVIKHPATSVRWLQAVQTGQANWPKLLEGYGATLDWPSMAFWRELSEYYPDAKVLLSTRDPDSWWQSISQTVLKSSPTRQNANSPWELLVVELFEKKFVGRNPTRQQALDAFNEHNFEVRKAIPADRLIEWKLGNGWSPLCQALDLPIPSNDFPHLNTTEEFQHSNRLRNSG